MNKICLIIILNAIMIAISACQFVQPQNSVHTAGSEQTTLAVTSALGASSEAAIEESHAADNGSPDNPIDKAFAYSPKALKSTDSDSVVFAYLYANLWDTEFKSMYRSYGEYLEARAPIDTAMLKECQNKTAIDYLLLYGHSLREKTLLMKEQMRNEGNSADYHVSEDDLIFKLANTDYRLSQKTGWDDNNPLPVISAIPEKDIYLYHIEPFGFLLSIKGQLKIIGGLGLSPRAGSEPEMAVKDWDNDGSEELLIAHTCITGVGKVYASAQTLYVVEYDDISGIVNHMTTLEIEDVAAIIKPDLVLTAERDNITLSYKDQQVTFQVEDVEKVHDLEIIICEQVRYKIFENPVTINLGVYVSAPTVFYAFGFVRLTGDVYYSDNGDSGNFQIKNLKMLPQEDRVN